MNLQHFPGSCEEEELPHLPPHPPPVLSRGSQGLENQSRGSLASEAVGPKGDHTIKEEISGKTRTVSPLSPACQNP